MLNEFFQSLQEGGAAVRDVARIPKANVQPTIDAFAQQVISKIKNNGWAPIGSTGKKVTNGDIDLAFDTDYSLEDVGRNLEELGIEHFVAKGLNEVNTRFPQYNAAGEMLEEFVQVDLMAGKLEWLELAFFTVPETETHYKAMHHTATLFGLLRGTDIENEDGSLTGWSMASTRGIFRRTSRKRINRNGKEVAENEKLSEYFPSPETFCRVISEHSETPWAPEDLLDSCENIWEKIREKYPTEIQSIIFKAIIRWCENQEIEVPNLEMALQEALDHIITKEKLHQTHAEDMVLYGAEGVQFTLETFESLFQQLQTGQPTQERNLSVKIDGAPVVFAGKNFAHIKVPFVAAKSILSKDAKYATNEAELVEQFGNRPGLLLKMRALLKYVPAIGFPEGECWRGDFLYSRDTLQHISVENKDYLTMHPNSLYYAAPEGSELAKRVQEADIGVVWHTRYNGEDVSTAEPIYSTDVSELNDIPQVFQTDPYLRSIQGGVYEPEEAAKIEQLLKFARQAQKELAADPIYEELLADQDFVKNFFMIFENHKVRTGAIGIDPATFIPELMEWSIGRFDKKISALKTDKAKASYEEKKAQFLKVLESRKETLLTMLDLMKDIAEIKDLFVDKLNNFGMFETFYKTISDNQFHRTGQEGFVISDTIGNSLKLINRAEFSHLNFSADTENGWKTEAETFKEAAPSSPEKVEAWLVNRLKLDVSHKSSKTWTARDPENDRINKAMKACQILGGTLKRDGKDLILSNGIKIEFKDGASLKSSAKHPDNVESRNFSVFEANFNRVLGNRKSINIQIKGEKKVALVKGVWGLEVIRGTPKADFAFVDKGGTQIYFISHKDGTTAGDFQQYGGLTDVYGPAWDMLSPTIAKKIQKVTRTTDFSNTDIPSVKKDLKNTGPEGQIKKLAVYGRDYNTREQGIQNVSAMIQGEITFTPSPGQPGTYDLHAAHILLNGEAPDGPYDPAIVLRYTGGRKADVDGTTFTNARGLIAPKALATSKTVNIPESTLRKFFDELSLD